MLDNVTFVFKGKRRHRRQTMRQPQIKPWRSAKPTTAYHPQCERHVERQNRTSQDMLTGFHQT